MKGSLFSVACWSYIDGFRLHTVLGAPWLVFFLQRAHAPSNVETRSNVETATPFGREHALKGKVLRHDHPPGEKCGLAKTQEWMQAVILHTGSDRQAVASATARKLVPPRQFPHLIRPSRTLDSFDRIGIYRGMYLARLQEALQADYPGLLHFWVGSAFPTW